MKHRLRQRYGRARQHRLPDWGPRCEAKRKARRSRLARRYGCFRLPKVPGAKTVKEARKGVNWLARTDPDAKQVEFSEHFDRLSSEGKRYIVLHERAHLRTGPEHNDAFYSVLKGLIAKHRVPWKVAYELEQWNCHHKS